MNKRYSKYATAYNKFWLLYYGYVIMNVLYIYTSYSKGTQYFYRTDRDCLYLDGVSFKVPVSTFLMRFAYIAGHVLLLLEV